MALSKRKKEEAYYSFSKLLKFSINAFEHSINNYEVTSLKPTELQGYSIIDSIKDFTYATDMIGKFDREIFTVTGLVEDLKKASARSAEKER